LIPDVRDPVARHAARLNELDLARGERRIDVAAVRNERLWTEGAQLALGQRGERRVSGEYARRGAGIERAAGLIACLADDKDNVFVTLSGRALNPALRIVSKVVDELARPKLITAGASAVVNTTAVGGLRMVSELIRPSVVTFLDSMLRDPGEPYRFEELTVAQDSPVVGRSLAAADLRKLAEVLVVATRAPGAHRFVYNPHADFPLEAGCTIVFLGRSEDLAALRPHFNATART
jgi:voltage-gated potassium channel